MFVVEEKNEVAENVSTRKFRDEKRHGENISCLYLNRGTVDLNPYI